MTYTLEHDGTFYVVENVPARVDEERGEQFFAPSTVERLQKVILGEQKPDRVIETPVYKCSERAARRGAGWRFPLYLQRMRPASAPLKTREGPLPGRPVTAAGFAPVRRSGGTRWSPRYFSMREG